MPLPAAPHAIAPTRDCSQASDLVAGRLLLWAGQQCKKRLNADQGAWTARRARHRPWDAQPGKGGSAGSRAILSEVATWVSCCSACGALTDYRAACRQARKAGRSRVDGGDGCGGAQCSEAHRRARFRARQKLRAHKLLLGANTLVEPGDHIGTVHVYERKVAADVARVVLAQYA